jgi:hypothetical protein
MGRIARLLRFFAASLVPGGGYFLAGWSPSTTLALYWVETLVGALAMGLRIQLHRRWTGLGGHTRRRINAEVMSTRASQTQQHAFGSFLAEFLVISLVFTLAHGVFLAAILGFVLERPNVDQARQGALGIVACHGLSLGLDTFRLETWPFARIREMSHKLLGRVVVVHLSIIGGMAFMAWRETPGAFFGVFVALKALTDFGSFLPQWNPREPPRWLVKVMQAVPSKKGETFEEYWRRTRAAEEAQAARDEQRVERIR